jgi:uncharacterized Zn-binding protein involved in type VI secretion
MVMWYMKKFSYSILLTLVVILFFYIIGCKSPYNPEAIKPNRIQNDTGTPSKESGSGTGSISLELTYPAGKSPQVFSAGWVFGAQCLLNPNTQEQIDISDRVRWVGDAVFSPAIGNLSRPSFKKIGENVILLEAAIGENIVHKQYTISTVSPVGYARVTDKASCNADAHGCPACPHPVVGPIISGSPDVLLNGLPAARMGDIGTHATCCGPNTFKIAEGDPDVLINGKPAARYGDRTQHCGGIGQITRGAAQSNTTPTTTAPSPAPAYSRPVVNYIAGSATIADYGQQLVTIRVSGGKQPYHYELVGNELVHSVSLSGNGIQLTLKKSQFNFDGQVYRIYISVKDSNGQDAAWKSNDNTMKTKFTLGYKYDPGEKNAAGKWIRQPSWVCFTEPMFPN